MTSLRRDEETVTAWTDWRLALRLFRYVGPYKSHVAGALVLTALSVPLITALPLLTKEAIDLSLAPHGPQPPSGFELLLQKCAGYMGFGASVQSGIFFLAVIAVFANTILFAIQYAQPVIAESIGQKVMRDLRQEMFVALQLLPVAFYDRTPAGKLLAIFTSDIEALNGVLGIALIEVVSSIFLAIYIVIWMLRINLGLALVSCLVLSVIVVFSSCFRAGTRSVFLALRSHTASVSAFLQEHISGMQVVQLFTREASELAAFRRISRNQRDAALGATLRNAFYYSSIETIGVIGVALIVWYGGTQVLRETISLGTLVAAVQIARAFYDPITSLSDRYHVFQAALVSSERIFRILDEPQAKSAPSIPAVTRLAQGKIEFRNVWFAYQEPDWVLRNISFVVEAGESVALVGHTGAGKTTITHLLLRFYDIQQGQILLDDVDIRQLDVRELRANFSIVPQDILLFAGDIASNIRLDNESISLEQVSVAARQAGIAGHIESLDRGYESELRERGTGLSVGQRQLIGFARALAFSRPILILDEATSSVDGDTEAAIHSALTKLMNGRTSIMIAHRFSTIQSASKILVLHKGEIHESGNHLSLVALRGLYWRLCQLQWASDPDASPREPEFNQPENKREPVLSKEEPHVYDTRGTIPF